MSNLASESPNGQDLGDILGDHIRSTAKADDVAAATPAANPFRRFWDLGYHSVIPIVPPGAPLSANSVLQKSVNAGKDPRGKAPGICGSDGLWMGLKNWQTRPTQESDLEPWFASGAGVGLVDDGGLVLLDIDATDEATANAIERDALEAFGPAPLRVGSWPKRALVYQVDEPLVFKSVTFAGPTGENRIEVLAHSKQMVVHGIHPKTGKPYEWRRPIVPRDKLTHVTRDQVDAFLDQQRAKLPAATISTGSLPVDRSNVDQEALKSDIDRLRRAVGTIPNTKELFPHRDDMVRFGLALHAACADDLESGREMFHEWASRWEGGDYDYDKADQVWNSLKPPHSIGAPWLYAKARRYGGAKGLIASLRAEEAEAPLNAADASDVFGAEPKPVDIVDIFGHGDPAELGTPPAGALPPVIAAWARTEARRKGVSEAFASASAVAVAASAIGGSLRIQVKQHDTGWTEPASLWVTLIAPPGSAKSAIVSAAASPLKALDTEYRRRWTPRFAEWEKQDRAHRRRKDAPEPGPAPICARAVLDNFTTEKALRVFSENPRGVICTPDELVGMLGNFGAYKKSGDGDRAMMLRFFDGGEAMSDRVGGGTLCAESALLGVLASSQPDKIRELADGLGGDGLLQRFLFVMHDDKDRAGIDEAPDAEACDAYGRIVRALATAEYRFPDPIRLHPAAAAVREDSLKKLRSLKWLFGSNPAFAGHVEKFDKFLARLILTFHCINETDKHGSVDPVAPVASATVEMAVAFAAFLMRHSLTFYREFVGASDTATEAHWVASYFLAHPELKTVDKRKLYDARKSFRTPRGHKNLIATMCELETAGWVNAVPDEKDIWVVNPAIHPLFSERARREQIRRRDAQAKIKAAGGARDWVNGEAADDADIRQDNPVSVFD